MSDPLNAAQRAVAAEIAAAVACLATDPRAGLLAAAASGGERGDPGAVAVWWRTFADLTHISSPEEVLDGFGWSQCNAHRAESLAAVRQAVESAESRPAPPPAVPRNRVWLEEASPTGPSTGPAAATWSGGASEVAGDGWATDATFRVLTRLAWTTGNCWPGGCSGVGGMAHAMSARRASGLYVTGVSA